MRCTVMHRGVPLVAVDLAGGETALDLAPASLLPGYYQVLAPLFRRVEAGEQNTENLARGWCMTDEARVAAEDRVADGKRAAAELAALEAELELRELAGALVPTDRVHVTELSFAHPDVVTVIIELRESHAPVAAIERPGPRVDRGATTPERGAGGTGRTRPRSDRDLRSNEVQQLPRAVWNALALVVFDRS